MTEPSGKVRRTNPHSEIDLEINDFLRQHPNATRAQLDGFNESMDWRWGHLFWENRP